MLPEYPLNMNNSPLVDVQKAKLYRAVGIPTPPIRSGNIPLPFVPLNQIQRIEETLNSQSSFIAV